MATEGNEPDPQGDPAEGQPPKPGEQDPPKSFNQDEVDDIAARVRSKTKRQVTGEILDAFGVDSLDELKATFAKLKGTGKKGAPPKPGAGAESDDETNAALEAANKRAEKAEVVAAKLEAAMFEVRKREAVMAEGVPYAQAKRIGRMLEVEPDAEDDELKADVRRLKKEMPELFSTTDQGEGEEEQGNGSPPTPRPPSTSGNPGRGPRPVRKPEDAKAAATSRLHLRHPALKDKK